jgi:broad specificity phosphatase PhoE
VATFYLIRHAERTGDQKLLTGLMPGVLLTPNGRAQAERLARHLGGEGITRLLASPLERTRETAGILAQQFKLNVEISPALREVDAGEWTGKNFGDLAAKDERWQRLHQFRNGMRIPGGDSVVDVQARFIGEIQRLQRESPDGVIALVSHGDPIKIALSCFLGMALDLYDRLEIRLASVSVLRLNPWGPKILRVNEVPAALEN